MEYLECYNYNPPALIGKDKITPGRFTQLQAKVTNATPTRITTAPTNALIGGQMLVVIQNMGMINTEIVAESVGSRQCLSSGKH